MDRSFLLLTVTGLMSAAPAYAVQPILRPASISGYITSQAGGETVTHNISGPVVDSISTYGSYGETASIAVRTSFSRSPGIWIDETQSDPSMNGATTATVNNVDLYYSFMITGPDGVVSVTYNAISEFDHSTILASEDESYDQAYFVLDQGNYSNVLSNMVYLEGFASGLNGVNRSGAYTQTTVNSMPVNGVTGTALTGITGRAASVGTTELIANTVYNVHLNVYSADAVTGNPYDGYNNGLGGGSLTAHIFADPSFSIVGQAAGTGAYNIVYSPGIAGSAVPEPMAWAMMLSGFFCCGALMRIRSRSAALS